VAGAAQRNGQRESQHPQIHVGQRLSHHEPVRTVVRTGDEGQNTDRPQTQPGEHDSDHSADEAYDNNFGEMLANDVLATGSQRAPQARDVRGAEELREHQSQRVEDAHAEEHCGEPNLHATLVADDIIHRKPVVDVEDAIVRCAHETSVLLFVDRVVVHELAVALHAVLRWQLHPVLQHVAVSRQQIPEGIDLCIARDASDTGRR
jgi:hypothetical protein